MDYVRALRSPPPGAAPQEGPQFRIAAQIGAATHPPVTISMKDMGRTVNDLFFEWFLRYPAPSVPWRGFNHEVCFPNLSPGQEKLAFCPLLAC